MTYRELFYKATRLINNDQITLGEYEEMTKPLDREIEQEPILDKIRAEMESITPKAHIRTGKLSIDTELMIPLDRVLKVLNKYNSEIESQIRSDKE